MARRILAMGLLVALVGPVLAEEPAEPAPKPEGDKQDTTPNIGKLGDYARTSKLAQIRDDMLYLDALRESDRVAVFRRDKTVMDVRLKVQFKVDPVGTGERSVGLIFGSVDSGTYHCLYLNRREAILHLIQPGKLPIELGRRGGVVKPEGTWHEASVECQGSLIRVLLNGQFLFSVKSMELQPGWVGVQAHQGRVWVRRLDVEGKPSNLHRVWRQFE